MTNHETIISVLADGKFHCSSEFGYIKDDRARISELRKKGYDIISEVCDKRCGISHSSNLFMRKLISSPPPTSKNETANQFLRDFEVKEDIDKELNLLF